MRTITVVSRFFLLALPGFHCVKSGSVTNDKYYMQAEIDGKQWKVSGVGAARFSADYLQGKDRFAINVHAKDLNPIATNISFQFDFVPKPGRYIFNNQGSSNLDSGITAVYSYYDTHPVKVKWSESGYIDLESITRSETIGSFSFTAKGDVTNPETTSITKGSFKVTYGGSSGQIWPGP